jgi:hypothetical protein
MAMMMMAMVTSMAHVAGGNLDEGGATGRAGAPCG